MPNGLFRFAKYSTIGGGTFALDLLLLYLFIDFFGWHYTYAAAIAFGIAVSINYVLSRRLVFAQTERGVASGYAFFLLIAGAGMAAVVGLMTVLVELFDANPFIARVIVAGIVGMFNYLTNLYLNFRVAGKH